MARRVRRTCSAYSYSSHIPSGKYVRVGAAELHDVKERLSKIVNKIKAKTSNFFGMTFASRFHDDRMVADVVSAVVDNPESSRFVG